MAKQSGGNTAQRVEALVRPTVEGMGLRLWDVVFEKEGPDWYLRILIDRDGTMDTDTCAEVSHALDPILDQTAILVRAPASRLMAFTSTVPSKISGTSSSNRRLTRPGWVRLIITRGPRSVLTTSTM